MPATRINGRTYEEIAVTTGVQGIEIRNDTGDPILTASGLGIGEHDHISLSYTGSNLTGVVYKTGGPSGATVATLTLAYDGNNNLISITKS